MRHARSVLLVVALAVGSALTGCVPEGPGGAEGIAEGAATNPMDPYQAVHLSTLGDAEARAKRERDKQEFIAACMTAQGFDYAPWTQTDPMLVGEIVDLAMDRDEFRAAYGYGLTPRPGTGKLVAPNSWAGLDPNYPDPERDPALHEAYSAALYGVHDEADSSITAMDEEPRPGTGCLELAYRDAALNSPASVLADAYGPLMSDYSSRVLSLLNDPTMVGATRAWSDCMADAGYTELSEPTDARDLVGSRVDREINTFAEVLPDPDAPAIAELHEFDIAVAEADHACQVDSGYAETLAALELHLGQDFYAQHQKELEGMIDVAADH